MASPDRHTVVYLPRLAWWGLALLVVAPWAMLFVLRPKSAAPPTATVTRPALATAAAPQTESFHAQSGPWGELEYSRILIEPPEEFIISNYTQPDALSWFFKGYSESSLSALWESAGLDPAQRRQLDDPSRREIRPDAIVVRPKRELVIGLSPASRAKIYTVLAEFPENSKRQEPYRLRTDDAANWFEGSGVSAETIALTKRLFYPRGPSIFFSDDDIVLPTLSPTERIRFIKTLARKSALLVQMRIRPNSNIEEIARYWGRGRRSKDISPLLQSLTRRPEGGIIDIVHLLPPFARAMLYTYPLPSENPTDTSHDCHWTSLNFFKDVPDERFADIDIVKQTLLKDYYPVPGELTLGDILVLIRPDGVVVHSCVYIADNIVFTKNGPSFSVPWVLASLDAVVAFYSLGPPLEIRRYRLKDS